MKSLAAGLVLLLLAGAALADGKFYSDRIPPGIPYQRAILIFDGRQQTLTIESKFEAREGERFGWVVPVPAVPEFVSPDPQQMDFRYASLERRTKPLVIEVVLVVFFVPLAVVVIYLFVRRRWAAGIATVVVVLVLAAVASPSYMGVEILKEERVGPYEAQVVKGDSAEDLIGWLKQNGFRFDERDRAAIDGYVQRKWVFVAAKLDAGAKGARGVMVPPLSLIFPTRQAVYPLALTATAGQPVEILLYVTAPWRADVDGRLPLHYAGDAGGGNYLTKFRGVMTPEQMREDLVLRRAESNASYRRWELRW